MSRVMTVIPAARRVGAKTPFGLIPGVLTRAA
jgi:hypothetical protein